MEAFYGKWKVDTSKDDGFRAFFEMAGLSEEFIKNEQTLEHTLEIIDAGNGKMKSIHRIESFPDDIAIVQLDKEFDVKFGDLTLKSTISLNGPQKLRQKMLSPDGKLIYLDREVKGNKMAYVVTMPDGTKAKRCLFKV